MTADLTPELNRSFDCMAHAASLMDAAATEVEGYSILPPSPETVNATASRLRSGAAQLRDAIIGLDLAAGIATVASGNAIDPAAGCVVHAPPVLPDGVVDITAMIRRRTAAARSPAKPTINRRLAGVAQDLCAVAASLGGRGAPCPQDLADALLLLAERVAQINRDVGPQPPAGGAA